MIRYGLQSKLMPNITFGEKIAEDRKGQFINLKNKDEKCQIRFVSPAFYYDGKHFNQTDMGWEVTECARINEGLTCEKCVTYYGIMKELTGVTDENIKKEIKTRARKHQPKLSFYYLVLDRGDETAKIFQTTLSVRLKLEDRIQGGEDVMAYDYIIKRTEKAGSEYYTLERVDSADTKGLSIKEAKEVNEALAWDLGSIVNGKRSTSSLGKDTPDEDEQ